MAGAIITPRHFAKKSGVFQPIARPNNGWIELCANSTGSARAPLRIVRQTSVCRSPLGHVTADCDKLKFVGHCFGNFVCPATFIQAGRWAPPEGGQATIERDSLCVHESPARSVFDRCSTLRSFIRLLV